MAVQLQVLAVGQGTRSLFSRRMVLAPFMQASLSETVRRLDAGRWVWDRVRLQVGNDRGGSGQVALTWKSLVRREDGPDAGPWRQQGRTDLRPGTSAMVEVAPALAPGERLVLSLTARWAEGERPTVAPVPVEIRLEIYGVGGDEEILIQRPSLRTVTGRAALFSFDYPVPSASGGSFDHARLEFTLTPEYPRGPRLPLRLEVAGALPSPGGQVPVSRDERAWLRAGEPWILDLEPPPGETAGFRLRVAVLWRTPAFDGGGDVPL